MCIPKLLHYMLCLFLINFKNLLSAVWQIIWPCPHSPWHSVLQDIRHYSCFESCFCPLCIIPCILLNMDMIIRSQLFFLKCYERQANVVCPFNCCTFFCKRFFRSFSGVVMKLKVLYIWMQDSFPQCQLVPNTLHEFYLPPIFC